MSEFGNSAAGLYPETPLGDLLEPLYLTRPARLYAAGLDQAGRAGPRHFLADLPVGAAAFPLAAPTAAFLLVEDSSAGPQVLLASSPLDAAALEAWFTALLDGAGQPAEDGKAVVIEAGIGFDHDRMPESLCWPPSSSIASLRPGQAKSTT